MKINRGWLARHHACSQDRAGFTALFGRGATVEVAPLTLYAAFGAGLDLVWFASQFIEDLNPGESDAAWDAREVEYGQLDNANPEWSSTATPADFVKYLLGLVKRYEKAGLK